jgi:hypothetical protein
MIQTSGLTAKATSGDAAVTVIANEGNLLVSEAVVVNESAVPGFFSVDGGANWMRLPAGTATVPFVTRVDLRHQPISAVVMVKRIASGSDVTGVFAWCV